jgi:hypothetical protein
MIPKVIHKVIIVDGFKLPSLPFQTAIDTWKLPGYQVKIYSGNDCIEFIKKHYDKRTLEAFNKVRPYSYKCDLFRYLVLNIEGGWYSDMRQVCLENIDSLAATNHEFYCSLDAPPNERCMYTAFIGSIPGHPILKKTFELIIWNIEHEHYGQDCLYPTGPGAFIAGSIDYVRKFPEKCCVGRHIIGNAGREVIAFGKTVYIQCKYNNARGADNRDLQGANDYGEMWRSFSVY